MNWELIDKLLADRDDDDIAAAVLRDQPTTAHHLIAWAVGHRRRTVDMGTRSKIDPSVVSGPPKEFLAKLRGLTGASFRLGDRTSVPALLATRADHVTRVAMLQRMRDGIDITIAAHRRAIALLDEHAVDRLADLPPALLADCDLIVEACSA